MSTFTRVLSGLGVLRKRQRAEGRPALNIWTNATEAAAREVQSVVRDGAHVIETKALGLEDELKAMLADGSIDADELKRLRLAPQRLHQIAERAHDVGEVVS